MPLSPLDIHNKEFTRGFRGYDEDEVNDFLDQIIKDYEQVIKEKKRI
ncbi:DivIVA domain-containing protein, partial [Listeria monocytogenes]|nr:DivIVA domain-containing protein [Listeria monocytogenes]